MHHLTFKNLLASVLICFFNFSSAFAQETAPDSSIASTTAKVKRHLVSFAPLGISNKLRFRYEYVYSRKTTIGFQYSHYYDKNFPGLQALVEGRRYLSESAPLGFYLKGQLGLAYHYTTAYDGIYAKSNSNGGFFTLFWPTTNWAAKDTFRVQSVGVILGIGIGNQYRYLKSKRLTMDVYFGLRMLFMNKNLDGYLIKPKYSVPTFSNSNESPFKDGQFSKDLGLVGGLLNCGINLGYCF